MSNGRQLNQPFFKLLDKLVRSEVSNMARPRWCKPGEGYIFLVKPGYFRRWAKLIPQSVWQNLFKYLSVNKKKDRISKLVSDKSILTALGRPLGCQGKVIWNATLMLQSSTNSSQGVRGFILRDHRGQVIWCGCRHNRGIFNPLTAEVLALYYRNSPQFNL